MFAILVLGKIEGLNAEVALGSIRDAMAEAGSLGRLRRALNYFICDSDRQRKLSNQ